MRKINYKLETLIIWAVFLGIVSLVSIGLIVVGILLATGVLKTNWPFAAFIIPGSVLVPWVIPLCVVLIIGAINKYKQTIHPELIEEVKHEQKQDDIKKHALYKMHQDNITRSITRPKK